MDLIRIIHPDTLAAIQSGRFHPAVLLRADWPGDPVFVHSGIGTMTWDGEDWIGVGHLGGLSLPAETAGLSLSEGYMTLGGTEAQVEALHAQADAAYGRTVQTWFATVTSAAGATLIGEPFELWHGTMGRLIDQTDFVGESGLVFALRVELLSGVRRRANGLPLHGYEDQSTAYPGDTAGRWLQAAPQAAFAGLVVQR